MVSRCGTRPRRLALAKAMIVMFVMFLMVSFAGGCTLWSDYADGVTCSKDEDCFRAQGELCDVTINECVAGPRPKLPTPAPSQTPEVGALVSPMSATTALMIEPNDDGQAATQQVTQVQP